MKANLFVKQSLLVIVIAWLLTRNLYVGIFHAFIFLIFTYSLQLIQMKFKPNYFNIVKKYSFLVMIFCIWGLNFLLNSFEEYREITVLNRHVMHTSYVNHYQEETIDGNIYVLYENSQMGHYSSAIKLKRSITGNYIANRKDVTRIGHYGNIVVLIDYEDEVIIVFGSKKSPVNKVEFKQTNGELFILNLEDVNSEYYTFSYHFSDIDYNDRNYPNFIDE